MMEDRIRKQKTKMFILVVVGFLIGSGIYDFFGDGSYTFRVFSGILFAGVVDISIILYDRWKYPGIKDKKQQLEKDERNIIINGKAASFTVTIILFTLAVSLLIAIIMKNKLLGYLSAFIYLFIFFLLIVSKSYWNKKM